MTRTELQALAHTPRGAALIDRLKALNHYARRQAAWGTYAATVERYYRSARQLRREILDRVSEPCCDYCPNPAKCRC